MAVKLTTNHGDIVIELDAEKAPKPSRTSSPTSKAGHYDNTIFHRVINGFMIQGGGFEPGMKQKGHPRAGQERSQQRPQERRRHHRHGPHPGPAPATAQFFINVADNDFLNHKAENIQGWGYCVFGQGQPKAWT